MDIDLLEYWKLMKMPCANQVKITSDYLHVIYESMRIKVSNIIDNINCIINKLGISSSEFSRTHEVMESKEY